MIVPYPCSSCTQKTSIFSILLLYCFSPLQLLNAMSYLLSLYVVAPSLTLCHGVKNSKDGGSVRLCEINSACVKNKKILNMT